MRPIREIFRSYAVLDADGRHVNGSDKESNHHYGDAYEDLFSFTDDNGWNSTRESVELMMEVGVADGSSLLAWREVFPNALCVGFDIHPAAYISTGGGKFEFHLGDATTKEACERAAAGRRFDLIVDDATHRLEDVLRTLFWLWPYVRAGGMYVIEDGGFQDCDRARVLFGAEVVETRNPWGGVEPLVVLKRSR